MKIIAVFVYLVLFSKSNAFLLTMMRKISSAGVGGTMLRESEIYEHQHAAKTGRRRFVQSFIISSTYNSIASRADDNSMMLSNKPYGMSQAVCDPSVESYRKGPKRIHIVGTAHISSVSSRLSRDAVKETKVRKSKKSSSFSSLNCNAYTTEREITTSPKQCSLSSISSESAVPSAAARSNRPPPFYFSEVKIKGEEELLLWNPLSLLLRIWGGDRLGYFASSRILL